MTLTEFLTARIAEDKADPACDGVDEYNSCHDWTERRVVECEAKRRIVELHTRTEPNEHECAGDFTGYSVTDPELSPCLTLLLLALPYDDHPDYRDEWRT